MSRASSGGMGKLKDGVRLQKKESFLPAYKIHLPGFWSGMSSVVNPFGRYRWKLYRHESPRVADLKALHGDWDVIGRDLRRAMEKFQAEHHISWPVQEQLFDPESPEDVP